ncbi:MAG: ABC transporter ATP-binding protein, partial [Clostridiales bacterium]|nr:ABC transporter ATP-binding protein [Clostridiales bacterium]
MLVEMRSLTKHFGITQAVNDFTVTLPDGELVSLLGPSGCGKSTVLNMLAGILNPTSGQVLFDGEDVTGLPPERRGIGLVFQNYALYPHMTVLNNISFPLEIQKVPRAERMARAKAMADMVHVGNLLNRRPRELSGGQQQRVAIARALVKNPQLLLLDEPLSNLDARLRLEMREEIRRIQQKTQVTTVFVTHDQEEAMSISDHIALMKDGYLQQYDTPQELYNDPDNQFVADFLGSPPINHLTGTLLGSVFTLTDNSASFPLPLPAEGVPEGKELILAIRAESAEAAGQG